MAIIDYITCSSYSPLNADRLVIHETPFLCKVRIKHFNSHRLDTDKLKEFCQFIINQVLIIDDDYICRQLSYPLPVVLVQTQVTM